MLPKKTKLLLVGSPGWKEAQRPLTQTEIVERLRRLAGSMDDVAAELAGYGGSDSWELQGEQIKGAGAVVSQWAEEIEAKSRA